MRILAASLRSLEGCIFHFPSPPSRYRMPCPTSVEDATAGKCIRLTLNAAPEPVQATSIKDVVAGAWKAQVESFLDMVLVR